MSQFKPEILEVDRQQWQEFLDRIRPTLDEADAELIEKVFNSYEYLTELIGEKNMSITRLQKLLFGAKTEKTNQVLGETPNPPGEDSAGTSETAEDSDPEQAAPNGKPPPKGHGRRKAAAYRGAKTVQVPHESLSPGDACPECEQGTVYEKPPRVIIRITGQAPLGATRYELQKLRCHLCGKVFTAEVPEQAGTQKYDERAGAMIALLKYGSGVPFYRLAGLQENLEIPLPASTQWDVVSACAVDLKPVFEELIRQAAQGEVLYHDDTTVKILEFLGKRREKNPPPDSQRTGLYTSGIVATGSGVRMALFFSGRRHAGENLTEVLQRRAQELGPPIQMCDALSRNMPKELNTIIANCLAHARREFVDIHAHFPDESRVVLEAFRVVYHHDELAREQNLTAEERLQFHQAHSQPAMTNLHQWLQQQFDEKRVEPNSSLGKAIKYLQRHWEKLTRFLEVAGAPLDNNICERALKKTILHRKNSLFFKTQHGADVGDLYLSLIHTCELNQVNAFDYLTCLLSHREQVAAAPANWLPWNYREQLPEAMAG